MINTVASKLFSHRNKTGLKKEQEKEKDWIKEEEGKPVEGEERGKGRKWRAKERQIALSKMRDGGG